MNNADIIASFRNLHEAYESMCQPIRKRYKIPQAAFDIIMFLANNPMFSNAKDIVRLRGIKSNIVSINVDRLVNGGYIERRIVAEDRRRIHLTLTEKASDIVHDGRKLQERLYNVLTKGMSSEDITAFYGYVQIIVKNILGIRIPDTD